MTGNKKILLYSRTVLSAIKQDFNLFEKSAYSAVLLTAAGAAVTGFAYLS
jgi:hypothetical protein